MKLSHRWLQEFVDLDPATWTPERVSTVLTDLGLEVEHIENMAETLRGFVVGRVLTKEAHPKADKLSVCTVDVGDGSPRTIVCGAPNVAAGQTVPVALVGARVPTADFVIESRPLRGVTSEGMICSQAELGLGEDHNGIWVLTTDAASGTPLATALGIDDVTYEVAITPNRADCTSHIGIARDLLAYQRVHEQRVQTELRMPSITVPAPTSASVDVRVEAQDLCPHYIAHVVTNVRPVESPAWLKDRLTVLGLRPRNVIVDITNYINMELGQPLHAFDASKLEGNTIVVRRAHAHEQQFRTLDGKDRTLTSDMLMICDANRPVAIAGVMGGENSEVDDATTTVVIESAFFAPTSVRRTAKAHGLSTDASYRFERGIDPAGVARAADRAVALLCELAGGTAGTRIEVGAPRTPSQPIAYSHDRIRSLIGITESNDRIDLMLTSVECVCTNNTATPPSWRADLQIEADLAEEVMRLYGIDAIPSSTSAHLSLSGNTLPAHLRAGGEHGRSLRDRVRTMLVGRGYYDCITNVLTGPDDHVSAGGSQHVALKNALGKEFSTLRTSLLPSLLRVVSRNLRHGQSTVRVFEVGSAFQRDAATELGVNQREVLTLCCAGSVEHHWSAPSRSMDLFDLLGDVASILPMTTTRPVESAIAGFSANVVEICVGSVVVGVAGEVDSALAKRSEVERAAYAAVIDLRAIAPQQRTFSPVGQFPTVRRDLALVVKEEITAGRILDVVRELNLPLLRSVGVFDVYRDAAMGEGVKSIGIEMTFRSDERTLVDGDVDTAITSIIDATTKALGAHVRGASVA
jgi:phenylalanyl-tRNA synthetase beta chain